MVSTGGLQPRRPWLLWGAGIGVAGLLAVGTLQAREPAPFLESTVTVAELPAEASRQALVSEAERFMESSTDDDDISGRGNYPGTDAVRSKMYERSVGLSQNRGD